MILLLKWLTRITTSFPLGVRTVYTAQSRLKMRSFLLSRSSTWLSRPTSL